MAVVFNIKCKSKEEMVQLREKIRSSFENCSAYLDGCVALDDLQDDAFSLFIGNWTDTNIEFDIHSSDLLER